jgi:hypothetical protein
VAEELVGGNEPGVIGRETRTKSVVGVGVEAREYEKETRSGRSAPSR